MYTITMSYCILLACGIEVAIQSAVLAVSIAQIEAFVNADNLARVLLTVFVHLTDIWHFFTQII